MILITFAVMGWGVYQSLTYNKSFDALILGAGAIMVPVLGVGYVLQLRASSSEVRVFRDGIELYDHTKRSGPFSPMKIFLPKGEISDIKIAASLEKGRDPSTIRPGVDDMVVSTKGGKDFYLIKRPSRQLREAALLMGFSESVTGFATITTKPMGPISFANTKDDLQNNTRDWKLIIGFTLFGTLGMIGLILTEGRFSWSMLLFPTLFTGIAVFGTVSSRRDRKKRYTTPAEVSLGMEGVTMTFIDGSTRFLGYSQIKRLGLAFTSPSGKNLDTPYRGYIALENVTYSVSPEIAMAIREGYRSRTGHYPFRQPF